MNVGTRRLPQAGHIAILGSIVLILLLNSAVTVRAVQEELFGIAQACTGCTIDAPTYNNSIDGDTAGFDTNVAFTNDFDKNDIWEFTDFESTALGATTAATLRVDFSASGFAGSRPDTVAVYYSNDDGLGWFECAPAAVSADTGGLISRSCDVSAAVSSGTEANQFRVQFREIGDGQGDTIVLSIDAVSLTIDGSANTPPVSDAGGDQSVNTGALVTLDGSASSDPDGNLPLTYSWVQTGGTVVTLSDSTAESPTFTAPDDPSVLTFELTVTDSLGLADPTPDVVIITVNNQQPVSSAGSDQSVDTNALVTLDGSASSDPDGDTPLTYSWVQTGGTVVTLSDSTAESPTFTAPDDPSVLTFELTVTDSLGLADATPDVVSITVLNQEPVSVAGPDQGVNTNDLVTLDGSASSDPDGDTPLTYSWVQTGGPAVTLSDSTAESPTFTAPGSGATLIFQLTVTDSLGLADSTPDTVVVDVTPVGCAPLTGVTISGPTTGNVNTSYSFDATVAPVGATPPITYTWMPAPTSGQGTANVTYQWAITGTHAITVTAENCSPPGAVQDTHSVSITAPSGGDYSRHGRTGADAFLIDCSWCHDPHGNPFNLSSIRTYVWLNADGSNSAGPVSFTALTGTNSYDDGVSDPTSRICVTCHIDSNRPGATVMGHTGGTDHAGGVDYSGQDCMICHPHDTDSDGGTDDAFLPSGGTCVGCHTGAQDVGAGPAGGRRAIMPEFNISSTHHISGTVEDADCQVCHYEPPSHPADGYVALIDADTGAVYTETTPGDLRTASMTAAANTNLTTFCSSCHDANGANGNTDPFGDGTSPLAMSSHGNVPYGGKTEADFTMGCAQCHGAHGSDNLSIINSTIVVVPGTTTGPVVFASPTGADSFDEDSGDASDVDDICVTCHINVANSGFPMNVAPSHPGGDHSPAGGSDDRNGDCTTCHPHNGGGDPAVDDGFMPANVSCTGCHGAAQDKTGVGPAGGRRAVVGEFAETSHHVSGSLDAADCEVCHYEPASHPADGFVALRDPDSGTVYTESVEGGYRPAGLNAADNASLNVVCGSCHDGDGATRLGGSAMAPFSGGQAPLEATLHGNGGFGAAIEEGFTVGCAQCHGSHGSTNLSIISPDIVVTWGIRETAVEYTSPTGANSLDESDAADADDLCAACHANGSNPGTPMQNHVGGDHTGVNGTDERGNDCTTCHPHDGDGNLATVDGFMIAATNCTGCHVGAMDNLATGIAGGRRAAASEFSLMSSHVASVSDGDCQVCHAAELTGSNHSDGLVHLTNPDSGATIVEPAAEAFRSSGMTAGSISTLTTFCQACHDGDGANGDTTLFSTNATPPTAGTHANTNFGGRFEGVFSSGCIQCHGSHGSANLSIVRRDVVVAPGTVVTPVVFTSPTNADSLDESDADDSDDLCATCHSLGANPGSPMSLHDGGNHTAAWGSDNRGEECTTCHPHDLDGDETTLDGFMPNGGDNCRRCHLTTQDRADVSGPVGGRRAVEGEFSLTSSHVASVANSDCQNCHAAEYTGAVHANGLVNVTNPDTAVAYAESTAGAFRPGSLTAGDITNLDAFCQGCHDGDGATRVGGGGLTPFTGGASPAGVSNHSNGTFDRGCIQCHAGHGSDNLSLVKSLVEREPGVTAGPVSFTSPTTFDDGDAQTSDDICQTCHASYAGSFTHIGGANHSGGSDYSGTDCTAGCHTHDSDGDPATGDAFLPSASGGCSGCHNTTAGGRRQIYDDTADGNGTGGDFIRTSHHISPGLATAPPDGDCTACHDQSSHMAGNVIVFNADNTGTTYTWASASAADRSTFCLSCHDNNGSTAGGGTTPFSDGNTVPDVDTDWASSSHGQNYECGQCHDNGHGSNKDALLAPWSYTSDGDDDPLNDEEQFCFQCHDGSVASTNIKAEFDTTVNWAPGYGSAAARMGNDRHDVYLTLQNSSLATIECADCHDPHVVNSTLAVTPDPDPTDGRTPGSGYFSETDDPNNPNGGTPHGATTVTNFMSDWCLDCHDGSFPPGVVGQADLVDIYAAWGDSTDGTDDNAHGMEHASGGGLEGPDGTGGTDWGYRLDQIVQCQDCHADGHVSGPTPVNDTTDNNLFLLRVRVQSGPFITPTVDVPADNVGFNYEYTNNATTNKTPNRDGVNGYEWCMTCHYNEMGSGKSGCEGCHMHGHGEKF